MPSQQRRVDTEDPSPDPFETFTEAQRNIIDQIIQRQTCAGLDRIREEERRAREQPPSQEPPATPVGANDLRQLIDAVVQL